MAVSDPIDPYLPKRVRMVETQIRERGVRSERVLSAMRRVPRHQFVPHGYEGEAYEDHPIPIGEGQTISQPYVVAAMTEAVEPQPQEIVLEVGTGSGYQTAVLAELAAHVYSVERIPELAERAAAALRQAGYSNMTVIVGDGSEGYPAAAPYDVILVTAAAPELPQPLFEQLQEGGRLIAPVGSAAGQQLQSIHKVGGRPVTTLLDLVRFVPLIGSHGYRESW